MSKTPTEADVLDRGELRNMLGSMCSAYERGLSGTPHNPAGPNGYKRKMVDVLRHDAALRARIEALEAEREGLRDELDGVATAADNTVSFIKQGKYDIALSSARDTRRIARRALEDKNE